MTKPEEQTGVHKVIRKATHRNSAPAWIVYAVAYNFVKTELLWMTDSDQRLALIQNIPAGIVWVANNGSTIMTAVGIGVAAWQYIIRRRDHNERSTDR